MEHARDAGGGVETGVTVNIKRAHLKLSDTSGLMGVVGGKPYRAPGWDDPAADIQNKPHAAGGGVKELRPRMGVTIPLVAGRILLRHSGYRARNCL